MPENLLIKGAERIVGHPSGMSDVRVVDGRVDEVGADLAATASEDVFDAGGMIVMPGMADTHTHLWESLFRGRVSDAWGMEYFTNIPPLGSHLEPEDMYAGVFAGAVELLGNGVTTVLDYCHAILTPEHADAALQGLRDAGIRAVFAYDLAGRDPGRRGTLGPSELRFEDIERVIGSVAGDALLTVGVGINTIDADNGERLRREIEFCRGLSLPMTFHNNRGGELSSLEALGLLDHDILPAHCNYTTDDDLDALRRVDGFITTQPEAETYAGRRPYSMVGRAHRRGIGVALGVDVPALVNPAILTQMRLLYLLQRYLDGVTERHEGQVPISRRPGMPQLSTGDVLDFGTTNGLRAVGLGYVAGRVEPGHQADLVMIDTRPFGMAESGTAAHLVMNATNADVHSVLVAGQFRKRDGHLVGVDGEQMLRARQSARAAVLSRAGDIGARPASPTWWQWGEPAT